MVPGTPAWWTCVWVRKSFGLAASSPISLGLSPGISLAQVSRSVATEVCGGSLFQLLPRTSKTAVWGWLAAGCSLFIAFRWKNRGCLLPIPPFKHHLNWVNPPAAKPLIVQPSQHWQNSNSYQPSGARRSHIPSVLTQNSNSFSRTNAFQII